MSLTKIKENILVGFVCYVFNSLKERKPFKSHPAKEADPFKERMALTFYYNEEATRYLKTLILLVQVFVAFFSTSLKELYGSLAILFFMPGLLSMFFIAHLESPFLLNTSHLLFLRRVREALYMDLDNCLLEMNKGPYQNFKSRIDKGLQVLSNIETFTCIIMLYRLEGKIKDSDIFYINLKHNKSQSSTLNDALIKKDRRQYELDSLNYNMDRIIKEFNDIRGLS
jgi:hypothetical protein